MSSQNNSHNRSGNRPRNNNNNNRNKNNSHRRGVPERKNKPEPPKLNWWQKILAKLGLYTPPTPSQIAQSDKQQGTRNNTQSKTNNNKSGNKPNNNNNKTASKKTAKKRAPKQAPPQQVDSSRLYVGNLSYDVTEQDLKELFKGFGNVKSAEVVYNKRTQRSKGFAFVQMVSIDDAKRAVEVLHEQPFMGRNMIVNGARTANDEWKAIENPAAS